MALLTAVAAVWFAAVDAGAHADVLRFDAAPVCEASVPLPPARDCKAELRAIVETSRVTRGRAHVGILTLRTVGNFLVTAYVDGPTPDAGEDADVVLWRGKCVIVRTDGIGDIPTRDNPAWKQSDYVAGVLGALAATVVVESAAAACFLYFAVDRERLVAAFLIAAVPLVVTVMLRISHAYEAVVVATIATPVLILGLYVIWPRIPWAQKQQS